MEKGWAGLVLPSKVLFEDFLCPKACLGHSPTAEPVVGPCS